MPDQKIDIHLATTADTSGVEQTGASFDQLDKDLDQIVSNMERLGAEFQDAIAGGDADLAKEKFAEIRQEAEKLKATMAALGADGVEDIEALTNELKNAEKQIESLTKKADKGDDSLKQLVDLEKVNQLGEITNSVINSGRNFETLTDMVRESDGSLGDYIKTGQQMAQTGTEMGLSIIRASAAFPKFGGAIAAVALVVQASVTLYKEYKRAQTAAADATKKFTDAAAEATEKAKAQAESTAAAAKASKNYDDAVAKRAKTEKAWADQLARSNGLLDLQEEKLNKQADAAKQLLQAKADLAKAQIDADKNLTDDQKDDRKRNVDEKLARAEFAIDQSRGQQNLDINKQKRENLTRSINEKIAQVNSLQQRADSALSKDERAALEAEKNAAAREFFNADKTGNVDALEKARDRFNEAKSKFQDDADVRGSEFGSKEEIEAIIQRQKAEIEALRGEQTGLKNAADFEAFDLSTARNLEGVRRETTGVRDRAARGKSREKKQIAEKEDALGNSSEVAAAKFAKAAAAGLKSGRKADAEVLQKISEEFKDGANAQELKKAASELAKIQSSSSSSMIAVLKSTVSQLSKQAREIALMQQQVKSNRP